MNALSVSPETLAPLVIALGFAAGLNVYATVLALGVMARLHWVVLPSGLEPLANVWVLVASGALFAVEFFADKVPAFDVVWNVLHTFVRVPVAALLAYQATSHLSPGMQALATAAGAAFAAIAHGSKTAARVMVTPSPEPVSNIMLSASEDVVAIGLSWAAMHHPLVAGGVAIALSVAAVALIWISYRAIREGLRRFFGQPTHA